MKRISLYLVLIIINCSTVFADVGNNNIIKKNIAVMNFQVNNVSPALGRAITDLLAGKLFQSRYFTLLERSQMDLIIKEKNFTKKDLTDKEYLADLGNVLDVEKMVVGSVSKLDGYTIEIRIIDVKSRSIDFSISKQAESIKDFKNIVTDIDRRVDNYYSGYKEISGDYDISLNPAFLYSSGGFSDNAQIGYGFNFSFIFNKLFYKDMPISITTGFYNFIPEKEYMSSFYMVPLNFSLSYRIDFTDTFRFIPTIGAGYLFSIVKRDDYQYRLSEDYTYKSEYYYNPLISLKSEFNFKVYHGYYLSSTINYMMFFESDRINSIISLDVGLRILF